MKQTKIEWCHHTFNPWWGCEKVSEGCKHCYAEAFAKRVGHRVWGGTLSARRTFGEAHWAEPLKWDATAAKAGERSRVFCASMADVFEHRRDLDVWRDRLWELIAQTHHLDWLLLTKRPENMVRLTPESWRNGWPSNVWAGCTVEDQDQAQRRIPHLLRVPAALRFLSCEPLLQEVDLRLDDIPDDKSIDWVIIGGESGGKARMLDLAWARSLVSQCLGAVVPVFVKQLGAAPVHRYDNPSALPAGYRADGLVPYELLSRKGGDPDEWPEDLQVREFPR